MTLRSLYNDLSHHLRMQSAKMIEAAGIGERERKRVAITERLRPICFVLVDYRVRNIVVIDPSGRRGLR
jgi:hypothetical protein